VQDACGLSLDVRAGIGHHGPIGPVPPVSVGWDAWRTQTYVFPGTAP
jgi:hypothetical protein